jgi:voltage-gated potassium channel
LKHVAPTGSVDANAVQAERYRLLERVEGWLETPMVVLAFAWLALLILDLVWGESVWFETIGTAIWIVFIADFTLEFAVAPRKLLYLKRNWLTALSLLVPALRVLRIVRVARLARTARAARGLRLLRVLSSLNRGMAALSESFARRGFGYVIALTVLITFAGAAGMYAFERDVRGGFDSYAEALWWTGMVMTTMGSQYWPQTTEGRVLCVFLALYAFAVFGYVTAALATFFVGRDAELSETNRPSAQQISELRDEVRALREEMSALSERLPRP